MTEEIENSLAYYLKDSLRFEKFFRLYYSKLCGYAYRYLQDIDESEEVVQDLFCNIWNKKNEIIIKSNLDSYVFRAVRNSCLNVIKHKNIQDEYKQFNKERIINDEGFFEDAVVTNELYDRIRATIDKLPPERRKIFIMSRFDGLKYREIAEKQHISEKTVENQMGKAIRFLRNELIEYFSIIVIVLIEFLNGIR